MDEDADDVLPLQHSNEHVKKFIFDMDVKTNKKKFEDRLIETMCQHKRLFIDNDINDQNIIQFIDSFHSTYGLIQLLNDFDKYTIKERKNNSYAEIFYNKLNKTLNDNKCFVSNCKSIARSNRDLKRCRNDNTFRCSLYGNKTINNKEIICHQLLDSIHVHVFHSFDMAYKLFSDEKKQIDGDSENNYKTFSEYISTKMNEFKRSRQQYDKKRNANDQRMQTNNKFMTIVRDEENESETFCDHLVSYLLSRNLKKHKIQSVYKWLIEEEYDTETITYDTCTLSYSNIQKYIHYDTCFDEVRKYCERYNPDKTIYSFGYRYYYWQFYNNNNNQTNIILQTNSKQTWYDRGNDGYKCCDWYISQKYKNLKEEIINNEIQKISLEQFEAEVEKAKVKIELGVSKRKKANKYWEIAYNIKKKSPVTLNHIVSLLLYCNQSDLCYSFSATFRKKSIYELESDEALKIRHSNYYHFGKLLRELIEVYGTEFAYSAQKTFYHGINRVMYFRNCYAKICGPMSTTISVEVASGIFAESNGIVLELSNDNDLTFYMDCINYSTFSGENEMLFIGGFSSIPFTSIVLVNGARSYTNFVRIIAALYRMFLGDSNSYEVERKHRSDLESFIENVRGFQSIDYYAHNLFKHFRINVEQMKFNMKHMTQNRLAVSKKKKKFGYKSWYPIFFNEKFGVVKLSIITEIFENVEEITVEKWQPAKYNDMYKKNNILSLELMKYLWESVKSTSSCVLKKIIIALSVPMIEINTECPAGHNLTQFETHNDRFECDKCYEKCEKKVRMYSCNKENRCDYALCESCFESRNESIPYLLKTMEINKPLFNKISWKIERLKYKNKADRIYDAICFSKIPKL